VATRSTLSRAIISRYERHQQEVRASLKDIDICHINSDMWTSSANEAYGSFVVSYVSIGWDLETSVLRCCVVEGRHTAFAIAAFLLQVARDFDLSTKVGVVRTDGASSCVVAGAVLGDVGGRDDWEAGHLEVADGLALETETRADEGGASARHGGEIVSAEAGLRAAGGSSMGDDDASCGGVDGGAGAYFNSDNDEGGDCADLLDVGSDSEDMAGGSVTPDSRETDLPVSKKMTQPPLMGAPMRFVLKFRPHFTLVYHWRVARRTPLL